MGTEEYQPLTRGALRLLADYHKGCVFLSKKVPSWPEDDKDSSRRCILHRAESATHLTAKPIDCVFYTCLEPFKAKTPTVKESRRWFRRVLAVLSPRSLERYRALVEKDNAGVDRSRGPLA